jgi:Zn-dependent protease with chaperone function
LIYTNLLFFLTAIFLFSMDRVPDTPMLSGWMSLSLFFLLIIIYDAIARRLFNKSKALQAAGYFSTEKRLSFLAVVFFTAILFFCDAKYYLFWLSIDGKVPALVNIAGLGLFLCFLLVMWRAARRSYGKVFGREYTTAGFLLSNISANLPIVLPWIVLSLLNDVVVFLPWQTLQNVLHSEWGDLVFFGMFLLFVILFFPPLVRRLWGCNPLPDGALRRQLVSFCKKQHFSAEIYLWPLFEGRVLTAGVMGVVPGLRYILITPALIESMSVEELEAVMAHEIGHVKKMHLLLYFFLIGGFSILAGYFSDPVIHFFLSRNIFYTISNQANISPDTLLTIFGVMPMLFVMLLYFRYLFGYFLRNFERQADLHVFPILGNSRALISALEKIAIISGGIRDQPSWHHFGIGERVAYLEKCEKDPSWIQHQNRKVYLSLVCYILLIVVGVVFVRQLPLDQFSQNYQEMYAAAMILEKVKKEPNQALWLRLAGDMMAKKKMEIHALAAYGKALILEPANPEVMNNLAWLYLTSEDLGLRDPIRALTLARSAAILQHKGFVLDTLATAYWANGLVEEAITTEKQAAYADPDQQRYYLSQIDKFTNQTYKEAMKKPEADDRDLTREEKIQSTENGG